MATNDLDVQPAQDQQAEEREAPSEGKPKNEEIKSSVRINPDAPDQSGRFNKKDVVHMALTEQGIRTKGIFTVSTGRLHSSRAYWEYQLVGADGRPFRNGAWIREKDLRTERRRG